MLVIIGLLGLIACRDRPASWLYIDPLFLNEIVPLEGNAVYSGGYVFADLDTEELLDPDPTAAVLLPRAETESAEPPMCRRDLDRLPQILSRDGTLYLADFFAQLDTLAWIPATVTDGGALQTRWTRDDLTLNCDGRLDGDLLWLDCEQRQFGTASDCRVIARKVF